MTADRFPRFTVTHAPIAGQTRFREEASNGAVSDGFSRRRGSLRRFDLRQLLARIRAIPPDLTGLT